MIATLGRIVGPLAATGGDAGPAIAVVALLVLGLAVTMAGLYLLMGGGPDRSPSADPSDESPVGRLVADTPGACDWELHVDTGGEPTTVVRPAHGRPCCVHRVRLRSLEPITSKQLVTEQLTWSGDRTQVHLARVASETRQTVTTSEGGARGLGVAARAGITSGPGPTVTTPWTATADTADDARRAEQLWAAHLESLRRQEIAIEVADAPTTSDVSVGDRTEVEVVVSRECDSGHQLDATARAEIHMAAVGGPAGSRLSLPFAGAWVDGDLQAAATTVAAASPGIEVATVPRPRGALPAAAHGVVASSELDEGPVEALVVGDGTRGLSDRGFATVLGTSVHVELSTSSGGQSPVDVEAEVAAAITLVVRVLPRNPAGPDVDGLECDCAPAYELRLGELPPSDVPAPSPIGRLVVEGRSFPVHRTIGPDPDGVPAWSLGRPMTAT